MKITITLAMLATALFSQLAFGGTKIPIPFGNEEKVIYVIELPDQKEFQLADGRYFDLGSYYETHHVLWLSFAHSEPKLIGYLGSSDEYVVLTPTILKAIEITLHTKPVEAEVSFMDKIGGKILLSIFTLVALYGIYVSYFSKVPVDKEDDESISYWTTTSPQDQ